MSSETLNGEQAIFTSVRTPMAEGYRIIAASKGLSLRDKQTITRHCPSHDGLCRPFIAPPRGGVGGGQPRTAPALTFYALSKGRFCVALSCPAGAEHTGRGGQRVYTHNVVITEKDLRSVGYNPFAILRSMIADGLDQPQLKPPAILPPAELDMSGALRRPIDPAMHESLNSAQRCRLLTGLLSGCSYVVNLTDDWLESTEAVLLGIPGPMRSNISLGAGVRFSVGRISRLHVLHDDTPGTRCKLTGQPVEYIDPLMDGGTEQETAPSLWVSFVERHWKTSQTARLARRSSRAISDCSDEGLGRIARLYDEIDEIEDKNSDELLRDVRIRLSENRSGTEAEVAEEYLDAVQREFLDRMRRARWADLRDLWTSLSGIGKESKRGGLFAGPLIEQALRAAMRDDPLAAARLALELVHTTGLDLGESTRGSISHEVLENLDHWIRQTRMFDAGSVIRFCDRWQQHTNRTELLDRIRQACAAETPAD